MGCRQQEKRDETQREGLIPGQGPNAKRERDQKAQGEETGHRLQRADRGSRLGGQIFRLQPAFEDQGLRKTDMA